MRDLLIAAASLPHLSTPPHAGSRLAVANLLPPPAYVRHVSMPPLAAACLQPHSTRPASQCVTDVCHGTGKGAAAR